MSKPPGEWQSFDVIFRAPRFDAEGRKIAHAKFVKVVHNGQIIHENTEVTGPTRAAHFEDEKPADGQDEKRDQGREGRAVQDGSGVHRVPSPARISDGRAGAAGETKAPSAGVA